MFLDVDQVKQNMEKMIYEAAKVLIDAKVEYARTLFTDAVRHLQKIAVLAADYKTGKRSSRVLDLSSNG